MKNNYKYRLASLLFVVMFAACGGGGGGSDTSSAVKPNNPPPLGSFENPYDEATLKANGIFSPNGFVKSTATGRIFDFRQGVLSSPNVISSNDNVQLSLKTTSDLEMIITPTGQQNIIYSEPRNINSTVSMGISSADYQNNWITNDVIAAWAKGINGSGVKIAVLDDFTVDDIADLKINFLNAECSTITYLVLDLYFCPEMSFLFYELTHGRQVAQIISGREFGYDGRVVYNGPYRIPPFLYVNAGVITQYQKINISFSAPSYGIAFGAESTTKREDYLTHQKNNNGLFDQFKKWSDGKDPISTEYKSNKIVNLSLGGTTKYPVINKKKFDEQLALANSTENVPDALFVKAAGNSTCVISQANCDPLNAVLYFSPAYNKKTLIIGALGEGVIASYSNTAGKYASRFLVADGRGVRESDDSFAQGTSFAAPRVSGYAAMLRQKYPNLKAEDVADIFLNTASWNSRWGVKNETNQAIYGQGEVNLEKALNPIGMLP